MGVISLRHIIDGLLLNHSSLNIVISAHNCDAQYVFLATSHLSAKHANRVHFRNSVPEEMPDPSHPVKDVKFVTTNRDGINRHGMKKDPRLEIIPSMFKQGLDNSYQSITLFKRKHEWAKEDQEIYLNKINRY